MSRNVVYKSGEIARFYGSHRRRWDEFYPSERWVFGRAARDGRFGRILDVGCAAGGLVEALGSRFAVEGYVGVDISEAAIEDAKKRLQSFRMPAEFHAGDICSCPALRDAKFDLVTALSVVDWNLDTTGILAACWDRVAPGGELLLSLRLTPEESVCDIGRSYQYIWFEEEPPPPDTEIAQYTVLNVGDALGLLRRQNPNPASILAYGYWGKPSAVARTPFERLLFTVLLVRRPAEGELPSEPRIEAHWPLSAFTS